MNVVLIAIFCGLAAVLYGIVTSMQVLKAPAGSERRTSRTGSAIGPQCRENPMS